MGKLANILKSLLYLIGSDGLSLALPFLFSVFMGRYFGAEFLGEYSLAFMNIALALTIIDGGFDVSLARELASRPTTLLEKLSVAHKFKFNVWLISLPIIFIDGLTGGAGYSFAILLVRNLFFGYNSSYKAALRANGSIKQASLIETYFNLALYPLLFLSLWSFRSLTPIFLLYLVFEAAKTPILHKKVSNSYSANLPFSIFSFKLELLGTFKIFKERARLIGINFLSVYQYRAPLKTLGYITNTSNAGHYASGMRFLTVARIVPGALLNLFIPEFAKEKSAKSLFYGLGLASAIGLLGSAAIYFSAEILIEYSYHLEVAVPILKILAWTFLPVSVLYMAESFVLSNKAEKAAIFGPITASVLSVSLCYILIPTMGAVGAAWIALCSDVYLALFYIALALRVLKQR